MSTTSHYNIVSEPSSESSCPRSTCEGKCQARTAVVVQRAKVLQPTLSCQSLARCNRWTFQNSDRTEKTDETANTTLLQPLFENCQRAAPWAFFSRSRANPNPVRKAATVRAYHMTRLASWHRKSISTRPHPHPFLFPIPVLGVSSTPQKCPSRAHR